MIDAVTSSIAGVPRSSHMLLDSLVSDVYYEIQDFTVRRSNRVDIDSFLVM
jgi:hypothetical protein